MLQFPLADELLLYIMEPLTCFVFVLVFFGSYPLGGTGALVGKTLLHGKG